MSAGDETIVRGTGNVFADLGYPDAEERQTKLRLAHAINDVIARRLLTQTDGLSVERLMTFLTALDQDVEIVIRQKSRSRANGRVAVSAA